MSGSVSAQQMSPAAQNQAARNAIFTAAKPILQQIAGTKTFATVAAGANTLSINPLQVGFLRSFYVEVVGTITNTGTGTLTLTPNGADNLISNVTFNDFTGNPRHNCSGRSLSYVEAAKYRRIPGAAVTSDSVSGFGSIIASNVAPSTVANAGTATVRRIFEVPIMVDNGRNMAGGLWLGVNNQSTLLNITLNTAAVTATSADPLLAVYQGASGTLTNVTVTVYQEYWNNVPVYQSGPMAGQPMLPTQDLSTAYMITETNTGLTFSAGNTAYWNYPTFSKILGTYFTYDNNLALNAGTDINSISLQVSNYTIIRQFDPYTLDRIARNVCTASYPKGTYPIFSRMHNLDVSQYPSLQLAINPSTATNAYGLVTTELLRPVQYMASASGVGGA